MIHAAAEGSGTERDQFAQQYLGPVRAYLSARWRRSQLNHCVDDAVQEVFVECFQQDGPLTRVQRESARGFRPFLFGIARNIALRFESRQAEARRKSEKDIDDVDELKTPDSELSEVFDRAWAKAIMKQAADRQRESALAVGEPAVRRVEILRMRFQEGMPIRDIARQWNEDAHRLHREYAKARQEFRKALIEVVSFHHPGTQAEITLEVGELLGMLG